MFGHVDFHPTFLSSNNSTATFGKNAHRQK